MKKNTLKKNINEMRNFASRMPKTINEMLQFEGDDEMAMDDDFEAAEQEEPAVDSGMNVDAFVDDIRKKALKGMAQLADNPDDPKYQILKKIWQICDKKPEDQGQKQMAGM